MKFKTLTATVLTTAAIFALGACGNGNGTKKPNDIMEEVKEGTTITFRYAVNGVQEEALTKLAKDFMKENPKVKVELQNQSTYPDLQAKINSTLTSLGDLPTIAQAYPGWLWNATQDEVLVDLKPYTDDDTIGWEDAEPIREVLLDGAKTDGKQYGIPFNKSAEMLFYNADLLRKYGVGVPKTLEELKEASKTIYEKPNKEVIGIDFDSLNNYYAIGMKNRGIDFNRDLDLTSKDSQEVVDYYRDGVEVGYFRTADSDKYLSGPFTNEKITISVGSIAGAGSVQEGAEAGGYECGVAPRPEEINLQQGADIYMLDNATPEQRTAAFEFMKFLTTPDSQSYWAQQIGYTPILESVLHSDEYKNSKTTKVPAQLENAVRDLFAIPVEENADSAYNEMRTIMEGVFVSSNKDTKGLLKDAALQPEQA